MAIKAVCTMLHCHNAHPSREAGTATGCRMPRIQSQRFAVIAVTSSGWLGAGIEHEHAGQASATVPLHVIRQSHTSHRSAPAALKKLQNRATPISLFHCT